MTQSLTTEQAKIAPPKTKSDWNSLLEEARKALAGAKEIRVDPSHVRPMPGQPRTYFNPDAIARLADSMKSVGQVYPGIVRECGAKEYELLDGERRWRAAKIVGMHYRALLVDITNKAVPFLIAAIANFNREAHTPLEIADSIEYMYDTIGMPISEIARVLGITQPWAYGMLSLRFLHKDVRAMLDPTLPKERRLPLTAAIYISKMKPQLQPKLAQQVLQKDVSLGGLRREVVRVSERAGAPVRANKKQPNKRWKSIGLRVNQFQRIARDLKEDLAEPDFVTVLSAETGGFSVDTVLTVIKETRRLLEDCEKQLVRARKSV